MSDDSICARMQNGFDLLAQGDVERAQAIFRDALAVNPEEAEAWHGLACHARQMGHDASAIALVGRALRVSSVTEEQRARYHITLGAALLARGHAEPARAAFVVAQALNACDPRSLSGLAEALVALGRSKEARLTLERAVTLAADDAPILTRLAELHLEAGALQTALVCFERATERAPRDGRVWANFGLALYEASLAQPGRLEAAEVALERALALGAKTAETLNTRGLIRMATGHLSAARADMEGALVMAPQSAAIVNNMATLLEETGEAERAEAVYDAVIQREHGAVQARSRFNRGTLRLGQGRYAQGWVDFEARRLLVPACESIPLWDGSAGNKPIAVTAEQGLGDQVQFMRYLSEVVRRRPVRLRGDFAPLVRHMPSVPKERLWNAEGAVEGTVSLLSLPALLGAGAPSPVPYLQDTASIEPFAVGLCWAGDAAYRFDRRRSVAPELVQALCHIPGVRVIALQRGATLEGVETPPLDMLDDLLKAVSRCALVISVDTLVAHIAGAVGRPLWLLNRYGGDWRWRQPQAWYETCQKVFQPQNAAPPPECWAPVLEQVAASLKQWRGEVR